MTPTSAPSDIGVKRPAWLLILTLPAFVGFVALSIVTIATQVEASSAELTPAQLDELGMSWIALHLLWITPTVLAAIGLSGIAGAWRFSNATAVQILAGIALVLAAGYLVVQVSAFGFDGGTWGDSRLYPLGVMLSLAAGWVGTLPATILVSVALARHGSARKAAWTVAALSAVYLVFELLTYLPALIGSATFVETVGLPPFLLGFLWAALGVGLLRSRVSSAA